MTPEKLIELDNSLDWTDFERLLRRRLSHAMGELRVGEYPHIMLMVSRSPSKMAQYSITATWHVGDLSKSQTKGEILDRVIEEHNRHSAFEGNCKISALLESEG
jgi:hypothetical protein